MGLYVDSYFILHLMYISTNSIVSRDADNNAENKANNTSSRMKYNALDVARVRFEDVL